LFDRIDKDAHGPDSSVNALVISGKGKESIAFPPMIKMKLEGCGFVKILLSGVIVAAT